ncbi:P-selectin [Merluccius polli]|uniref:p-selectin n=1 Tax=Merluccius polli TaxID=89951 RepID=A0AA47MVT8_MERPO|nr:P-selectin [Merluccius polli]
MPQSRSDTLLCGASGHWNDSVPICAAECPVLPETDNMAVRCEGDTGGRFSYGSSCTFTCSRGYSLRGAHTTTCTATEAWSEAVPSCERVTCPMPQGDGRTTAHCSGPLDALQPGSTCSFTCEPGFEVQWAPVIACTEEGSWNASVPTCRAAECDYLLLTFPLFDLVTTTCLCERSAVQCSPPVAPESGQINCQPPLSVTASPSSYPQGSACNYTCNEGYEHQGLLTTECTQLGQWSSPPPTCTAVPPLSPTEVVLVAGGAVSLSALCLAVWLIKRLRKLKKGKFTLARCRRPATALHWFVDDEMMEVCSVVVVSLFLWIRPWVCGICQHPQRISSRLVSLSIFMWLLLLSGLVLVLGWSFSAGCTCSQLLLELLPRPWLSIFSAVVEVVPGGTPFHLDDCWCRIGDFVWSFSPGLVPVSPEHPQVQLVIWLHPPWWSSSGSGTLSFS